MDPLHASIEEFAADGYTHVECYCPRCRMTRLRPISWLPRISLGLTLAQLSARLREGRRRDFAAWRDWADPTAQDDLARGYVAERGATTNFRDGWFYPGDLVSQRS